MDASRHTPELEELLSVHALGALDGEDLQAVEEHLRTGCAECLRRLALLAAEVEELAAVVPPIVPSDLTRARLLKSLPVWDSTPAGARSAARGARSSVAALAGWLAAAVILVLCGGGWLAARREVEALSARQSELTRKVAALDHDLAASRSQNAELVLVRQRADELARVLEILSSPGMRPILLAGLKDAPHARGYTFVDTDSHRALFSAANLPALAPGKIYELWFIAAGRPVPAGTFDVTNRGSGIVQVQNVAPVREIQAWAVTIEPRGGVPQPTGPMVLKG
ncbi:MAG TPA: anti-sigma factor [Thermoanaerobaculia bacterium]|nr:anti-sigma factor [Thermoanaerobaculia bacterium]